MLRPIDNLFAGLTDAKGNFTSPPLAVGVTMWATVSIIAQTSGFAQWTTIVGGQAKKFDRGARADMPIVVRPGQTIIVQINNAQPLSQVTGVITGIGGDTFAEIAPFASLAANIVAVDTATPRLPLMPQVVTTTPATPSFAVTSGGLSGAQIFNVPPGAAAVRVLVTAGGLLFSYSLLVLGRQTTEQYYGNPLAPGSSVSVPTPSLPITIPIENDWDTQIEIHVENPTQNVNVFISALFAAEPPGRGDVPLSPPARPPDWQLIDTTSVISVPAVAGFRVLIQEAVYSLLRTAAGSAQQARCRIWNGTSGSSLIWGARGGNLDNSNDVDRVPTSGQVGAIGGLVTLDFDQAPAAGNTFEISASGWYV